MAAELTASSRDDASTLPALLDTIEVPIRHFTADGAYDHRSVYDQLSAAGTENVVIVIPPRRSAVPVAGLERPQHFVDAALERTLARRDAGLDELVDREAAFLAELEDRQLLVGEIDPANEWRRGGKRRFSRRRPRKGQMGSISEC